MDVIKIDNLELFAYHGLYDFEKEKGQHFYVNAVLETDTRKAGMTDRMEDSTSYGDICRLLERVLTEKSYNLLEKAAEVAAEQILLSFPLIWGVVLEIRKPEAPIKLTFESVSVQIERRWHKAYLAVGSNMGDTKGHIERGIEALTREEHIRLGKVSSLIKTAPYGGVEQDDFLNGAIEIDTLYTPRELLEVLHRIEALEQRERVLRWGPRTLDLDILLYDEIVLAQPDLMIPHVDMRNRSFVLDPLCEIAPYALHPISGKRIIDLKQELDAKMDGE